MMPPSKKQKLEKAEKDPVVYFEPQNIPVEVWNQIFKYSSGQDLLNLSLVCKKFYETIGVLPEAMDKIKLNLFSCFDNLNRWNEVHLQNEEDHYMSTENIIKSSRHFTNMKLQLFQTNKIQLFSKVIEKFAKLRSLEFEIACRISKTEFIKTLQLNQNSLRSLEIRGLKLNYISSTPETFKLKKLEKLDVLDCDASVIKFLLDLDILPNTLVDASCDMSDDGRFLKFLEKQNNLKRLVLKLSEEPNLLELLGDADIKFKLENLEIVLDKFNISSDSFQKFLKSQGESLRVLKLGNIIFQSNSVLKFMLKLEKLQLAFARIEDFNLRFRVEPKFCCPSLKTLIIDCRDFDESSNDIIFFRRFQDVREIVLMMKAGPAIIEIIAKNHKNLKKLVLDKFDDKSFNSVSFDNLEELHIINLQKSSNSEDSSSDINLENSVFAMKNLKVLKIGRTVNITVKSVLWILVNFKNLRHLEIHNSSQLTNELLCNIYQFFKNLQFLGINVVVCRYKRFIECLSEFPDLKYLFPEDHEKYLSFEDYSTFLDNIEYEIISDEDSEDNDSFLFDGEDYEHAEQEEDYFGEELDYFED